MGYSCNKSIISDKAIPDTTSAPKRAAAFILISPSVRPSKTSSPSLIGCVAVLTAKLIKSPKTVTLKEYMKEYIAMGTQISNLLKA